MRPEGIERRREEVALPARAPWPVRPDASPLRYPGGKRRLAPLIARMLALAGEDVDLMVEPFAGGAAASITLMEAGIVRSIALGDIDPLVAAFWKVTFSPAADDLASMAEEAPLTLAEWERLRASDPRDPLGAAYKCLFLNRTSFSGSLMHHAGPIGGKRQAGEHLIGSRFNRPRIAARIRELSGLRDRVAFVNDGGYASTMSLALRRRAFGTGRVLAFLDPPFFDKAARLYRHSFGDADHRALRAFVSGLDARWILSYDEHPGARELYGDHPGLARVGLPHCARVVSGSRKVAPELLVSDLLVALRDAAAPRRRPAPRTQATAALAA